MLPDVQDDVEMLERFGIQGMSSDESDRDGAQLQYKIRLPMWRNKKVTNWLRALDAAYNKLRASEDSSSTRGAQPHVRTPARDGFTSTSRKFVSGLPINAYDENWLSSLTTTALVLQFDEETYSFEVPAAVLE